jgi:hypothetical protein
MHLLPRNNLAVDKRQPEISCRGCGPLNASPLMQTHVTLTLLTTPLRHQAAQPLPLLTADGLQVGEHIYFLPKAPAATPLKQEPDQHAETLAGTCWPLPSQHLSASASTLHCNNRQRLLTLKPIFPAHLPGFLHAQGSTVP